MQISKMMGNAHARAIDVLDLDELGRLATSTSYSLATFKNGHRNVENFERADAIGLDFDDGMSLEDAKRAFAPYKHLILPTKSHRKDKNGVIADRFRVILFLATPITDIETYYATWHALQAQFPACDPACKDPSRMYYKSINVASVGAGGKLVEPVKAQPKPKLEVVQPGLVGKLSKRASEFLLYGAPQGKRHSELYFAARDAKQQGYDIAWFTAQVTRLAEITNDKAYTNPQAHKTIEDAFTKDAKHSPRVEEKAFQFMPIGDLLARNIEVDWIVKHLLTKGGTSIFAGAPKSGKSTLVRQLVANICHNQDFLGHSCKRGDIVYLAMEEQDAMLKQDFKRLGITANDPITIHIGGALTLRAVEDLHDYLVEKRPMLTVVDTLMDLANIKNSSDYAEVKAAMARLRKMARESDSHILFVHHGKKPSEGQPSGGGSILGSTAFFGGVDMALTIDVNGRERRITTRGRGIKQYDRRLVLFDEKTHTFTLGPQEEEF